MGPGVAENILLESQKISSIRQTFAVPLLLLRFSKIEAHFEDVYIGNAYTILGTILEIL